MKSLPTDVFVRSLEVKVGDTDHHQTPIQTVGEPNMQSPRLTRMLCDVTNVQEAPSEGGMASHMALPGVFPEGDFFYQALLEARPEIVTVSQERVPDRHSM